MSQTMISELAGKIARAQFTENWAYYLAFFALIAISAFFGGLLKSYAAEKGKFQAIEVNFTKVLAQLERTTLTTKSIELALSHSDWTSREYKTLRRDKLENLMFGVYETRDWIAKSMTANHEKEDFDMESTPVQKIIVIANLYFPELKNLNEKFFAIHQRFIIKVLSEIMQLKEAQQEIEITRMRIDALQKIGDLESQKKVSEIIPLLKTKNEALIELKKKFQQMLMPIYKELHEALLDYCQSIEILMKTTITP